ncbi:hypothetical protein DSL72_001400 [Monilinia vaccinii-corymbosi]|uniref:Uncharacterized protein n=1 Tax=Monilinia vaccinii-corymbosi TaxID=61207 RepID=A0A8A3P7Q2_9HELO|nr:hypothetical protein DSL72_001400 [Monilinia vaccinii-corymbosi]
MAYNPSKRSAFVDDDNDDSGDEEGEEEEEEEESVFLAAADRPCNTLYVTTDTDTHTLSGLSPTRRIESVKSRLINLLRRQNLIIPHPQYECTISYAGRELGFEETLKGCHIGHQATGNAILEDEYDRSRNLHEQEPERSKCVRSSLGSSDSKKDEEQADILLESAPVLKKQRSLRLTAEDDVIFCPPPSSPYDTLAYTNVQRENTKGSWHRDYDYYKNVNDNPPTTRGHGSSPTACSRFDSGKFKLPGTSPKSSSLPSSPILESFNPFYTRTSPHLPPDPRLHSPSPLLSPPSTYTSTSTSPQEQKPYQLSHIPLFYVYYDLSPPKSSLPASEPTPTPTPTPPKSPVPPLPSSRLTARTPPRTPTKRTKLKSPTYYSSHKPLPKGKTLTGAIFIPSFAHKNLPKALRGCRTVTQLIQVQGWKMTDEEWRTVRRVLEREVDEERRGGGKVDEVRGARGNLEVLVRRMMVEWEEGAREAAGGN